MKIVKKIFLTALLFWLEGATLSGCIFRSPIVKSPPIPNIYYRDKSGRDLLDPANVGIVDQSVLAVEWSNSNGYNGSQPLTPFKFSYNQNLPYLPAGYRFTVDRDLFGGGNVKYLKLSNSDTDTITYVFSGATLTDFYYNKIRINPPGTTATYPAAFPVIITK